MINWRTDIENAPRDGRKVLAAYRKCGEWRTFIVRLEKDAKLNGVFERWAEINEPEE
jgi:hypothetical protein